jgi:hypothetical protein
MGSVFQFSNVAESTSCYLEMTATAMEAKITRVKE